MIHQLMFPVAVSLLGHSAEQRWWRVYVEGQSERIQSRHVAFQFKNPAVSPRIRDNKFLSLEEETLPDLSPLAQVTGILGCNHPSSSKSYNLALIPPHFGISCCLFQLCRFTPDCLSSVSLIISLFEAFSESPKQSWLPLHNDWASLVAQIVKNLLAMQEIQVQFLDWADSQEKGMATHSSILAWRIPWTEEPGGLQIMGLQKSWTWLSN